jgi:hypothetical protein
MKKEVEVTIITPPRASTTIDTDLVKLTKYLVENGLGEGTGTNGALGGEFGYGVDFENEVFMMHHFCWCMKRDCPWCFSCYCEFKRIDEEWKTVKECDNHNKERSPNFWYKPTDLKLHWYKWIGRDMEFSRKIPQKEWKQLLDHCYVSLAAK